MKTVFVPLLIPFFNFRNEVLGAVRIYYGVVVSDPYITLSCSVDEVLRRALISKKDYVYGYCEVKDNPTLDYAINYAISTYFGNNSNENVSAFKELYNTDGSIVTRPKTIPVEKHLLSNDVLLLTAKLGTNSLEESVCTENVSYEQKSFAKLSTEYSKIMCDIRDVVKETANFSLCFSCYGSIINYLVSRKMLAELVKALILLGVDVDSLKVSGFFSKKYVVYVKSPHAQKTS